MATFFDCYCTMYIQTEPVHVYNVFAHSIDGTVTDERKSNTSEMGVTKLMLMSTTSNTGAREMRTCHCGWHNYTVHFHLCTCICTCMQSCLYTRIDTNTHVSTALLSSWPCACTTCPHDLLLAHVLNCITSIL